MKVEEITKQREAILRELNYVETKIYFLEYTEQLNSKLTNFQEEMLDRFQLRVCELHAELSGLVY